MIGIERKFIFLAIILFALVLGFLLNYLKGKANERNVTVPVLLFAMILGLAMSVYVLQFSVINNSEPGVPTEPDEKQQELLQIVREKPSSVKAWNQLGREYLLKQNFEKAYQAFNESRQVDYAALFASSNALSNSQLNNNENIERLKWLTGIAESRVLAQRGAIDEESENYLNLALSLDPNHPKALWYGGLNAAQKEQYVLAKSYWEKLKQQNPPGALGQILDQRLQSLEQFITQKSGASNDGIRSEELNSEDWQLKLKIVVPDELRSSAATQTRIFISLRQDLQQAPLAARQLRLEQLQEIVILSASDAIPAMRAQQSANWDSPLRIDILWAPSGKVDEKTNIRFASMLNRDNLKGVNEFVLDPKLALKE